MSDKKYIGDGCYVESWHEPGSFVLTTEDGLRVTNRVVLEPEVLWEFLQFVEAKRQEYADPVEPDPVQHYDGPIEAGMEFWWMPRTRAQQRVTVTKVTNEPNGDVLVWSTDARGEVVWNDESRWREACERIEKDEP